MIHVFEHFGPLADSTVWGGEALLEVVHPCGKACEGCSLPTLPVLSLFLCMDGNVISLLPASVTMPSWP